MRRWLVRILIVVLVLAVVIPVAIQLVLWSDLPRSLVVSSLREELGLAVEIEEVSAGWMGHTVVRGFSVRLPAEDEALLEAPRLNVDHTGLLALIVTRSLELDLLEVVEPTIHVRRTAGGRWNVVELAEVLAQAPIFAEDEEDGPGPLPTVRIVDARLFVPDPNGRAVDVGPLQFAGEQGERGPWRFRLEAGPAEQVRVAGSVAPDQLNTHTVEFAVGEVASWLPYPQLEQIEPFRLEGRWQGRYGEELSASLELAELRAGEAVAAGSFAISTAAGGLRVEPVGVTVRHPSLPAEKLQLAGGLVEIGAEAAAVEGISAAFGPAYGQLWADWSWQRRRGTSRGTLSVEGEPGQQGRWRASFDARPLVPPRLEVTLEGRGGSPLGRWDAAMRAEATFREPVSQWQLELRQASVVDEEGKRYVVRPVRARLELAADRVRLVEASGGGARRLDAKGEYVFEPASWSVAIKAEGFNFDPNVPAALVDARLDAAGDPESLLVRELVLDAPQGRVSAFGRLGLEGWELVEPGLSVTAFLEERETIPELEVEAHVIGGLAPVDLAAVGTVRTGDIPAGGRRLAALTAGWNARVTPERVEYATEPFQWYDASWVVAVERQLEGDSTEVEFTIRELAGGEVARLAEAPSFEGLVDVEGHFTLPDAGLAEASGSGEVRLARFRYEPVVVDEGRARFALADGRLLVDEIDLRAGPGHIRGQFGLSIEKPTDLGMRLLVEQWPIVLNDPNYSLWAGGQADLRVDLSERYALGAATIMAELDRNGERFAELRSRVDLDRQLVRLEGLEIDTAGGMARGEAVIELEDPVRSRGSLSWEDLDLEAFAPLVASVGPLQGRSTGELRIAPAEAGTPPGVEPTVRENGEGAYARDLPPVEPVRVDLRAAFADASLGAVSLENASLTGYVGSGRVLLSEAVLELLEGSIDARGSWTRHGDELTGHVIARLEQLNLDQMVRLIDPNAPPHPGYVGGRANFIHGVGFERLAGQADLTLSESALVKNPVIGLLQQALQFAIADDAPPTGTGTARVMLDGSRLMVPTFIYRHQALEARGALTMTDVSLGAESPIEGHAMGTTRPLQGIDLPGVSSLDRLMQTLQTSAAVVKIGGTLGEVQPELVPFPEVSSALRRLLWDQLRGQEGSETDGQ